MPREVIIVNDPNYGRFSGEVDAFVNDMSFSLYARHADYVRDGLDSNLPQYQTGEALRRQELMRVTIRRPRDPTPAAIRALTIAGFAQAVEWADRGPIAFSLDHGLPGLIPLAPAGALTLHAVELEKLEQASAEEIAMNERWQAVVDLGRTLVDARGRSRIRHIDVMSCRVALGPYGERAIDALARIWGVTVRGLYGDFVTFESRVRGFVGGIAAPELMEAGPVYGLLYTDRWPDDPRFFYISRGRQHDSHARARP